MGQQAPTTDGRDKKRTVETTAATAQPRPTSAYLLPVTSEPLERPTTTAHRVPSARRLQVAFALFLVVLVIALSGLIILLVSRIFHELTPSMRAELEWKVRRGSIDLAQSSDLGLALGDSQVVTNAFAGYRENTDVISIVAVDTSNKAVAIHGRPPVAPESLFSGPAGEVRVTDTFFTAWAPSNIEGKAVGKVALVLSKARLEAGERLRRSILAAAIIGCVIALGASLFFVSFFLGPLIRLTQESLRQAREMEIARRIQTSMLPRRIEVEALKISAAMIPAEEVGGDYYDVIPFPGGCWIGVGDVAGHGVQAGLIMLMVQSAVAALTKENPNAAPKDVLTVVNRVLHDNIRTRLVSDEYVTFTLMRYLANGSIVFAGAHEEILVCRAATGRCERLETPGAWMGAVAEVKDALVESTLQLYPGDVVVLYTDGITEARNTKKEQFGIERLSQLVEQHRNAPVDQIQREVLDGMLNWSQIQDDDVTLLVMRYRGLTTT